VGNKKALIVQNSPPYGRRVGTVRAQFLLDEQGLPLPFPTLKELMAPTPISPLVEYYVRILLGVKLF
jgi:hypothetical protein